MGMVPASSWALAFSGPLSDAGVGVARLARGSARNKIRRARRILRNRWAGRADGSAWSVETRECRGKGASESGDGVVA